MFSLLISIKKITLKPIIICGVHTTYFHLLLYYNKYIKFELSDLFIFYEGNKCYFKSNITLMVIIIQE